MSQGITHDRRHGMPRAAEEQRDKKTALETDFFVRAELDSAARFLTLKF